MRRARRLLGRRIRPAFRIAAALACVLACSTAAATAAALDLAGTWYVLIHYRDDTTQDPAQLRWDERVWVFERAGAELRWTEYPIVVFEDDTGRFTREDGRYQRVLGAFEPNEGQKAAITRGLEVNPRGAKKKSLRGSDASGWSSGKSGGSASASIVTYSEVWSVRGLPAAPVFTRDDVLGAATMESMEGRTQLSTEAIDSGGDLLRGRFERDGTRHGTFRMQRAGATGLVSAGGKTPNEKLRERFEQQMREELGKRPGERISPGELERFLEERELE